MHVAFGLNFGFALFRFFLGSFLLGLFVLVILFVEHGEALHHRVDLLFLLVHELLLQWFLCGQLQCCQQILLSPLLQVLLVVVHLHTLLLLEGQIRLDRFWHF